jgi:hypothetical protein
MPAAGFEHAIPAIRCLQIYALDHTPTEIMDVSYYNIFYKELADPYSFRIFIYGLFNDAVSGLSVYRQNETRLVNGEMQLMVKYKGCGTIRDIIWGTALAFVYTDGGK